MGAAAVDSGCQPAAVVAVAIGEPRIVLTDPADLVGRLGLAVLVAPAVDLVVR